MHLPADEVAQPRNDIRADMLGPDHVAFNHADNLGDFPTCDLFCRYYQHLFLYLVIIVVFFDG